MTRQEEIRQEKIELRKQLEAPDCKLDEVQKKLEGLEAEEAEIRKKAEIVKKLNEGEIAGKTVETRSEDKKEVQNMEDKFGSMEYRKAFAQYVCNGTPIPAEYRAAESSTRADATAVIPTTVANAIVEKIETYGGLYAEVMHTSYPAGFTVPTSSVRPVAEWVAEGAGSDTQKKTYSAITFAGNKLRVAVSCSLELSVAAISAFEQNLAQNVADAFVKAFDTAIVAGTGAGQPKGILRETAADKVVLDKLNYSKICEMEAAIPSGYDANAVYVMSKKTLFAIRSLKDAAGVVAIETIDGKPAYSLLGRRVVISPTMPDLDKAKAGDVVAFAMDLSNYVLNFNYAVSIQRRENWDNENQELKAVAVADGKTVDANGLVFYTAAAKA